MFQGSRAWPQWGVVHRFHVLMACRKFWFSNIFRNSHPPPTATTASSASAPQQLSKAEMISELDKMGAATWEENIAAKADPATQERQDSTLSIQL
jgi:hypothetical protein